MDISFECLEDARVWLRLDAFFVFLRCDGWEESSERVQGRVVTGSSQSGHARDCHVRGVPNDRTDLLKV